MTVARRRLLQALTLAGFDTAAAAQDSTLTLEALRSASRLRGTGLSDDRLQILKPVLERRFAQLQALRGFEIDDAIGPTPGILVE